MITDQADAADAIIFEGDEIRSWLESLQKQLRLVELRAKTNSSVNKRDLKEITRVQRALSKAALDLSIFRHLATRREID